MTEPSTEAGRRHFELMSQRYARLTRADIAAIEAEARAECEERTLRLQETVDFLSRDDTHVLSDEGYAYVQAEARADLARRVEARVAGWLSDPMWPQFGPGIGVGPFDAGHMAARAAAEQVLDVVRDEAAK